MRKEKINWLSILQGWTMLWVVIGHAPLGEPGEGPVWENFLYHTAYSFHMALFMVISGFLFYRTRIAAEGWSYPKMLKDKAMRLLLPMAVFTLAAFALKILFPAEVSRDSSLSLGALLEAFICPYNGPLREMWFIMSLMWMFALMPLWRTILSNRYVTALSFLVIAALHYFHPDTEILNIGRTLKYAVWFFLGLLLGKYDGAVAFARRYPLPLLAAGIVIYVLGLNFDETLAALGGIVISISLAFLLDRVWPRVFSTFRDYTYQIFLMGIFAQVAVRILVKHIQVPYPAAWFICLLAGLYIPVAVAILLKRLNFDPLLRCIGMKAAKSEK
ncbi:MAG: acyltransferase [Bacteroidales bacterium]|nr:acyltransferase [Bacteroidales bacterium]